MYQIWLEDGLLPLNLQEEVQNISKRKRIYGFPRQCIYFSQIYKWLLVLFPSCEMWTPVKQQGLPRAQRTLRGPGCLPPIMTPKLKPQARKLQGLSQGGPAGHTDDGVESMPSDTKAHAFPSRAPFLSVWPGPPHASLGLCWRNSSSFLDAPRPTESAGGGIAWEYS